MTGTLTPPQQTMVSQIQELHRLGEPLNITAVKRRHPELLEAVYAMRPFWGWRRAVESAGILYQDIRIELKPTVTCAVCGNAFPGLRRHLKHIHQIHPHHYLKAHPGSELINEVQRAARKKGSKPLIPHWEPLWSREYILDRMMEYRRLGIAINPNALIKKDPCFVAAANRYWGSMRKAMKAAGLDPLEITEQGYRRHQRYPNASSVLAEIQRRQQAGLGVNITSLLNPREGKSDVGLVRCGKQDFGSWDKALEAAGIDPSNLPRIKRYRCKYANATDVVKEVRRRAKQGLPITHAAVYLGPDRDVMLTRAGKAFLGSWDDALRAAGYDPKEVRKKTRKPRRSRFPDAESVLAAIRERDKTGQSLRSRDLTVGKTRDPTLKLGAIKYFNAWYDAVQAAGFDPAKTRFKRRAHT